MTDWRIKCAALHVLNILPAKLHKLTHHISGRYFLKVTSQLLAAHGYHVNNFRKVGGAALEFGAGSNLLCPLLLSNAGATQVFTYDLSRLATVQQVNHVIRQLRSVIGGDWPEVDDLDDSLIRLYRIHYMAPADARSTGLPSHSIDFICSTSTLEHIPVDDIYLILKECQRLGSRQALFSFLIDYHDHYASADSSITRVNFYRYSERAWKLFNPPNHYQNRLRHSDYERIFHECKLAPIESRAVVPHIEIDNNRIAPCFRSYNLQDLMALNGFFTMKTPEH